MSQGDRYGPNRRGPARLIEDTTVTAEDLRREGFPNKVLDALTCVTKREGEEYPDFVRRAATNPVARRVKLADHEDNMGARRVTTVTEKDARRMTKYITAWRELKQRPTDRYRVCERCSR